MNRALAALLAGVLFGAGLVVSGMTDPSVVRAFLDLRGAWDPSLAFVMVGAIGVHAIAARLILRRQAPALGGAFTELRHGLDSALVGGAAIFGVGWALGGWCPGPGVVSAGAGHLDAIVFLGAMVGGMAVVSYARKPAVLPPSGELAED